MKKQQGLDDDGIHALGAQSAPNWPIGSGWSGDAGSTASASATRDELRWQPLGSVVIELTPSRASPLPQGLGRSQDLFTTPNLWERGLPAMRPVQTMKMPEI
jgi:hypothetical protein